MEENKVPLPKEDNPLTRTVYAYVSGKISDSELIKSIKEMSDGYPYDKNNLKPFSLEAAKAGKPVCTRDGRKVRIICFDKVDKRPIVALISDNGGEFVYEYLADGKSYNGKDDSYDLMMLPEKKEGWVNVYRDFNVVHAKNVFDTKQEALENISNGENCIATVRIEWEE